jgi:hypothetical protein
LLSFYSILINVCMHRIWCEGNQRQYCTLATGKGTAVAEKYSTLSICCHDLSIIECPVLRNYIIYLINNILDGNVEIQSKIQNEIIQLLRTIMEQNYFQFDLKYYKQVGAPAWAILAKIFIQHMEHLYLYPIPKTQNITAYYRYVDDILIIYDKRKTNI